MLNSTEKDFISHLANYLPERKPGKRGPKPVSKYIIVEQLFVKFRHGLRWKDLEHATVCYNYFSELQRRGKFKNFFNQLIQEFNKFRQAKTIIDSSDLPSYRTNGLIKYSGKYHNYCLKMTVEVTPECIPIDYSLDRGSSSDSKILDKMLQEKILLPYEMYLDKGYEKYDRRRRLKAQNCQVRMEMKKGKNRKRGPRFQFSQEHKEMRGSIEKVYGWLKAFMGLKLNRLKKKSLIMAKFIICLSYIAFMRMQKL